MPANTTSSSPIIHAYAWASGRIDFTTPKRRRHVPKGALHIASGPQRLLKRCMNVIARHGYGKSKGILLVPGVPEASLLKRDPVEALKAFRAQARRYLGA